MVGHSIASSLLHEVGHQAAALLGLVESLRPELKRVAVAQADRRDQMAWQCWERWISEIVADLWSVSRLGIGSTMGLIGVVGLPRWYVFRVNLEDPHPVPWIRVMLSATMGEAVYPHRQWGRLRALWRSLYPPEGLPADQAVLLQALERTMPAFVAKLLQHRPATLKGRTLGSIAPVQGRRPEELLARYRSFRESEDRMRQTPPTLVFATLGQARAAGRLSPELESRLVGDILRHWALASTLDISQICADSTRIAIRKPAAAQAAAV
jgi:hypothetical protein